MLKSARIAFLALALAACGQESAMMEEPAAYEEAVEEAGEARADDELPFCDAVQRRVSASDCAFFEELAVRAEPGEAAFNIPRSMLRDESVTIELALSYAPPPPPPPPAVIEEPMDEETAPAEAVAEAEPPLAAAPGEDAAAAGENVAAPGAEAEAPAVEEQPAPPPAPPQRPRDLVEALPGDTIEYNPQVGRFMRAELSHDGGFEVTQLSPASQEVIRGGSPTTWRWRVRATDEGVRRLELKTVIQGCLDDAMEQCFELIPTRYHYDVEIKVGWFSRMVDYARDAPDAIKIITAIIAALAGLVGAIFGLRAAFRKGRSEG